jgi:hypothetical protein
MSAASDPVTAAETAESYHVQEASEPARKDPEPAFARKGIRCVSFDETYQQPFCRTHPSTSVPMNSALRHDEVDHRAESTKAPEPSLYARFKAAMKRMKREVLALYYAVHDPRTPWLAKILPWLVELQHMGHTYTHTHTLWIA